MCSSGGILLNVSNKFYEFPNPAEVPVSRDKTNYLQDGNMAHVITNMCVLNLSLNQAQ